MMNAPFLCFLIWCVIIGHAEGGLYNENDAVVLLDNNNFYNYVLHKENGWIIQFYNTWCGHCQHFAPLYKRLALDMKDWKDTVKIGVLDCAEDANSAICREYEVTGYPTVQTFPAFLKKGDIGVLMPYQLASSNVNSIEKFLLDELTSFQYFGNGSKTWPNLQSYWKHNISEALSTDASHVNVAIFESESSVVGRQVILDLHFIQQLRIVRVREDDKSISAAIVQSDGSKKMLQWTDSQRESLKELIAAEVHVNLNDNRPNGAHGESVSVDSHSLLNTSDGLLIDLLVENNQDQVYMVDIENVLSYMFHHEFALHRTIEGESIVTLKKFVKMLYLCLPTRAPVHQFLGNFKYFMSDKLVIKGEDLSSIYESITTPVSFLPSQQPWIRCLGSEDKYRGYPCGLWTMFHALTVSSCAADDQFHVYRPSDVLAEVHGFVRDFFSCRECSKHFQEMYAEDAEDYVRDQDDVITWLWKSHNRVNRRLRNTPSEDPLYKKVPFPSVLNCPQCWTSSGTFIEREVLKYLKHIYSGGHMSRRGLANTTSAMPGTPFYQNYLAYYEWYSFALMYTMSSVILVCCFILLVYKCKRHSRSKFCRHNIIHLPL